MRLLRFYKKYRNEHKIIYKTFSNNYLFIFFIVLIILVLFKRTHPLFFGYFFTKNTQLIIIILLLTLVFLIQWVLQTISKNKSHLKLGDILTSISIFIAIIFFLTQIIIENTGKYLSIKDISATNYCNAVSLKDDSACQGIGFTPFLIDVYTNNIDFIENNFGINSVQSAMSSIYYMERANTYSQALINSFGYINGTSSERVTECFVNNLESGLNDSVASIEKNLKKLLDSLNIKVNCEFEKSSDTKLLDSENFFLKTTPFSTSSP